MNGSVRRRSSAPISRTIGLAIVLALVDLGCGGAARTTRSTAPQPPVSDVATAVPNLFDVQREIQQYIDSDRYEADVQRVADDARAYLQQRAGAVTKPAIVLDIDETSLSNWPAYRLNGWARIVSGDCDLEHGPCGLRAWQARGQSKALQPTLGLTQQAKALGVAVFFISGRPPELRAATERNLREQGYRWDEMIVFPPGVRFASAVDFKAPERKKISDRGYTILVNIGDQDSDLAGGLAERTFKLPNPVYLIP
jgi:acid phosphatase